MNSITAFDVIGTDVSLSAVSASRGILAMQGIGLSGVGAFGTHVDNTLTPILIDPQDKPSADWHLAAAPAVVGAYAAETGNEPVQLLAARLRNAHPASVIRTRHRCRPR
ncbi:hypothetical protein GV794_06070 [Nocardia cyriacigeorgica]|uniref:Uncharacterized protein n=1 Tax=Nocardia cyriacigeorgica TaxID=135487 RepID=A0A6P1D1C3_9NOCA|nr:hypothetical protein [Nocardia cyriacigeorgica]NEW41039.1 hypothetical protein [Nocardia cyriacigeorgica]NEW44305.1 hypothetical protein [Nocardia cyriacigeorgica]NEW52923.1 hypothetical protein [Nocardia cyriacigeorgica]NEW55227.1 hypothetical protein [Nocardia cyriacigeorgica]